MFIHVQQLACHTGYGAFLKQVTDKWALTLAFLASVLSACCSSCSCRTLLYQILWQQQYLWACSINFNDAIGDDPCTYTTLIANIQLIP